MTTFSRRSFTKTMLGLGATGMLPLSTVVKHASAAVPTFTDYKALVCVFLYGGSDSFSMVVPTDTTDTTQYGKYSSTRGTLAVQNNDLGLSSISDAMKAGTMTTEQNLYLGTTSNSELPEELAYTKGLYTFGNFGINGVMPELAQLIQDRKASVICNVGNLVQPISKSDIADNDKLPLFLFAHNHQQRALQTGQGDNLNSIGWAGRIADLWRGVNNNSKIGLNVSLFGNDRMLIGEHTTPLVLGIGQPPTYESLYSGDETNDFKYADRRALFRALNKLGGVSSADGTALTEVSFNDPFRNMYSKAQASSINVFSDLSSQWQPFASGDTKGPYGEALFAPPPGSSGNQYTGFDGNLKSSLTAQLGSVASMIELGKRKAAAGESYNRQIFMVLLGGFDTHAGQKSKHALLLRELSLALWHFQLAMEEAEMENNVVTFTMSDFGRTLKNNGDGTDHGWGGHQLVMGGDGTLLHANKKMIGNMPDFTLAGESDYKDKGQIIPAIAQDQLNATICQWFGVPDANMKTIFPNITNFGTNGNDLATAYLQDLFAPRGS